MGSEDLYLAITADRYDVAPAAGRQADSVVVGLHVFTRGGLKPYTYAWTVTNPLGLEENERLDRLDVAEPFFTSGETTGPYLLQCTLTDALGQETGDTVVIRVEHEMVLDLETDRGWVASGGGRTGQAAITATATGGTTPYTYEWSVIDPDGEPKPDRLTATLEAERLFVSSQAVGTYQISCRIRDASGETASDSVEIVVGEALSAEVAVDRQQLLPRGGVNGVANVSADVGGGREPYQYLWSVIGPDGMEDASRLDDAGIASPVFTSTSATGTYRVSCTVADSAGQQAADSVLVLVGQGVGLVVSANRRQVPPGGGDPGQVVLEAEVVGGAEPCSYSWSVVGPDGAAVAGRLDDATVQAPVFTSANVIGPHRVTCRVTDARGEVGVDSVEVYVGQPLAVDVTTSRQDVSADGGRAEGFANVTGGIPPYQYAWVAINPVGSIENVRLSSSVTAATVFTSDLTTGTYTLTCVVTDSAGFTAVDSANLVVAGGLDQSLSLDVTTTRQNVPPSGGQTGLQARATGGVDPLAYTWVVLDQGGADVTDAVLNDPESCSPIFTAPEFVGTYRIGCTVTDSVGKRFTDSVDVFVGLNLSARISASRQSIVPGGGANGQAVMTAAAEGGSGGCTYQWEVRNPLGLVENDRLDSPIIESPVFASSDTVGTYRISCVVTDSLGSKFGGSTDIFVGLQLVVAVTTNRQNLMPGGGIHGRAVVNAVVLGGMAGYSYQWEVRNPGGTLENYRLDSLKLAQPVFTSGSSVGTYQVTCTVTDALGSKSVDAVQVCVGDGLSADVSTDRSRVNAGGGANGQAHLAATSLGGSGGYDYLWEVTAPSGAADNDRLDSTTTATPTFTSGAGAGTYRIRCIVTDSSGASFVDSTCVDVGQEFFVDLSADRSHVVPGGGPNGQVAIDAWTIGGLEGYTYQWEVTNPAGNAEDERLDTTTNDSVHFTSDTTVGSYRVTCTVTDSAGQRIRDSILILVGQAFGMDVTSDRQDVHADGGQAAVAAKVCGGIPPYQYVWVVTDPNGSIDNTRLSSITTSSTTFTSNLTIGTYTLTCVAADAAGFALTDSISVVVGGGLDQGLSLDVTTARRNVPANGGQTILGAVVTGGVVPVTYAWTVRDPTDTDVTAAALGGGVTSVSPTFTAPATVGTYRIACTVTDSVDKTFTDSVDVFVGVHLSAAVTTNRQSIVPGGGANGQAALDVAVRGGSGTFSYVWTVTDPSGGGADARLNATNVQSPTFTSDGTIGTYRVSCLVTDSLGSVFIDSVDLFVGLQLVVTVTTSRQNLVPGGGGNGQAVLNAAVLGGLAGYAYAWSVTDPLGNSADGRLSDTGIQAPTFTSNGTVGTYRISCTVTDSVGSRVADSTQLHVGRGLSLDVTADKTHVVPGGGANGQSILTAAATGGKTPYTYLWSATDQTGASADGRLSATNVTSPTFTSDATVGTYRITCTVTDDYGSTFADSVHVLVGRDLSVDVTAVRTRVMPGGGANGQTSLTATAQGGSGGYACLWSATDQSGASADGRLSATNVASPTFTSNATVGTYRVVCTVTDSSGATSVDSIHIYVGRDLGVVVTAVRTRVMPGGGANGQTVLTATPQGGSAGYTYSWSVTDQSGAAANGRLNATNLQSPTFTSNATVGTYRVMCTVTDSSGSTSSDSIHIFVGRDLSVDVKATRTQLPPGGGTNGQASLTATPQGGSGSYTYLWSVTDQSGASADARLSATNVQSPTFTSDTTMGTYRVACTVTDAWGATTADSVHIYVGTGFGVPTRIEQAASQAGMTNHSPINFTATFGEAVSGFTDGDVTLGGTAGATTVVVTGGPTTYNVAVSGMVSDGTVIASIGANVCSSAAGNGNLASTSTDNVVIYDTVAPNVITVLPLRLSTVAGLPLIQVVFSKSVTGVDAAAFTVNGSPATVLTGSGAGPYTFTGYAAPADGVVTVALSAYASSGIQSTAGNPFGGDTWTYTKDSVPPAASSIQRLTPAGQSTNAASVIYRVTFSENVNNVSVGDFTITDVSGSITGESIDSVSAASGTTIDVIVNTGTAGEGDLRLDVVVPSATINDDVGNNLISGLTGQVYTVDHTAPTVTSVVVQTGLTVDVTFSEPMGSGVATAVNYTVSGSGKGTLADHPDTVTDQGGGTYRLTWSSGEMVNGGDITVAVANVEDQPGNAIGVPNSGTHAGGGVGVAPTVTINEAVGQSDPTSVSPINFTVVFSEPVVGFEGTDVVLSGLAGATTAAVTEIAPNNGTTYNVAVSGMTSVGQVIADVAPGVCTDSAGNTNEASTSTDHEVQWNG